MSALTFTERQRATIAAALTLLAVVVILWVVGWSVAFFARLVSSFSGVLLPLATAGILALILKPFYEWLLKWIRYPVPAALIVFLTILVPLGCVLVFLGGLLLDQLSGLMEKVPVWMDRIKVEIQQRSPGILAFWQEHGLGERLRLAVQRNGDRIANLIGSFGGSVLTAGAGVFRSLAGLLGWVVLPVYLFFILISRPPRHGYAESLLPFLKPDTRRDFVYLITEFINLVVTFFRGQFVISLMQGALYAAGFLLAGLQFGILIGLFMGLMNLIPYLGSMLGLLIALPTAFFQDGGGLGRVAAVSGVIVLVQLIEGYLLTPRIMGERTGLHPMAIIFGIFFWGTALNGIIGMILAIPLTAFVVVLWRLLKAKYIKELV
jgi:predicted PurR-regulated permease PerM